MTANSRAALRLALIRDEGLRIKAYDDATGQELKPGDTLRGNLTIGIGHNLTANGLKPNEIEYICDGDIEDVVRMLDRRIPWWNGLDEVRQRVLVNLGFNLGGRLFEFHRTLGRIEEGDYAGAAESLLDSKAARDQAPSRYLRLATVLRTGVDA